MKPKKFDSEAGRSAEAPAGTDMAEQAGASPAPMTKDRGMDYLSQSGTQKTHPAKPAQPKTMRYLG